MLLMAGTSAFAEPWRRDAQEQSGSIGNLESENCQSHLGNHSYLCHVKSSFGSDFTDTFAFTSPGIQSSRFDLEVAGIPDTTFGCACVPGGGFADPSFDDSFVFHCVGPFGVGQMSFRGAVTGAGKIKPAEGVSSSGDTFAIKCKQM